MSLESFAQAKWIISFVTTRDQMTGWLRKVDRDLMAARIEALDFDNRLKIAYDAARQLAEMSLAAAGYRSGKGQGSHYYVIQSLHYTICLPNEDILLLDVFRRRRNMSAYDEPASASEREVTELLEFATELRAKTLAWMRKNHPALLPI